MYRPDEASDKGRFSSEVGQQFDKMYQSRYWNQREFETIEKLRAIAAERGEPLPKLSVAWILANPTITAVILGASRPDQLTDTLAACDLNIDAELKNKLDEITAEYRLGDSAR